MLNTTQEYSNRDTTDAVRDQVRLHQVLMLHQAWLPSCRPSLCYLCHCGHEDLMPQLC